MGKLVLILGVIFLTMSSFSSSKNLNFVEEIATTDACSIYADQIADDAVANGGNYFQAWFFAYNYCVSIELGIGNQ